MAHIRVFSQKCISKRVFPIYEFLRTDTYEISIAPCHLCAPVVFVEKAFGGQSVFFEV